MVALTTLRVGQQQGGAFAPQVIIVGTARDRAPWVAALQGCGAIVAGALSDLETLLAKTVQVDAVVAPWEPGLLKVIESSGRRIPLIHIGPSVPEELLDAVAAHQNVGWVDQPEDLEAKIFEMTRAPRSPVARREVPQLRLVCGGREYELCDLSNAGLSFRVKMDEGLEGFFPGAVLEGRVMGLEGVCLDGVELVVRHVTVVAAAESYYRVGCALRHASRPARSRGTAIVRDRAQRAGLLRAALSRGGILLSTDEGELGLHCLQGRVDVDANLITFETEARLEPYTVVRGRFELGGASHKFVTAVVEGAPLRVRLPSQIEVAQERVAARLSLPSGLVTAILTSTLDGTSFARPVVDLSSSGFAFAADPSRDVVPSGLVLAGVELKVAGATIRCRGRVTNLAQVPGGPGLRCGVAFEGLEERDRALLASFLLELRYPGVRDGGAVDFAELRTFFRENAPTFFDQALEERLEPDMPEIGKTFRRLGPADHIAKALMVRDGDSIDGYVSAVRAYSRTWYVQHLAGRPGRIAGLHLSLGMLDYLVKHSDVEYMKMLFAVNNPFPARTYGRFAKRLLDPYVADLRRCDAYTLATDGHLPPSRAEISVGDASNDDLALVEGYFVREERNALVQAEDLTRHRLRMAQLDSEYHRAGLTRRRRILVARDGGRVVGFALLELSSPGLSLRSILTSFRVFVLPAAGASGRGIRLALIRAALGAYRAEGFRHAALLTPSEEDPGLAGLPVADRMTFYSWTCHRSQFVRGLEYMERLATRFMRAQQVRGAR